MSQRSIPGLLVLLINLDRSVDRLERMEKRLTTMGLAYERLMAVDGKARWAELAPTVNIPVFERNVGRDVMQGEIGCYHSHLLAWKKLLNSKHHTLLVLEDDVVFHANFLSALMLALENSNSWDILNFNKIRAKQPISQVRMGDFNINAYMGPLTGMGSYLISADTVARLLPNMLPIKLPIDLELDRVHLHDLRRYGCEPFPSHVDDENQSTITGNSFSGVNKYPWYRRIPTFKRRLCDLIQKQAYLFKTGRIFNKAKMP